MASVTFDPAIGGDGLVVTDNNDPATGLGNGGHRVRFVPALNNIVGIGNFVKDTALSVSSDKVDTAASAAAASGFADDAQLSAEEAALSALAAQNAIGTFTITPIAVTLGQTVISIPEPYYPNTNTIMIFIEGVFISGFTEDTINKTITLNDPISVGVDEIILVKVSALDVGVTSATNVSYNSENVQTALDSKITTVNTLEELRSSETGLNYKLVERVAGLSNSGGIKIWRSGDRSIQVSRDEVNAGEGDGGKWTAPLIDKTGTSGAWELSETPLPEHYGAFGDGVAAGGIFSGTDDTLALQAWLYGNRLYKSDPSKVYVTGNLIYPHHSGAKCTMINSMIFAFSNCLDTSYGMAEEYYLNNASTVSRGPDMTAGRWLFYGNDHVTNGFIGLFFSSTCNFISTRCLGSGIVFSALRKNGVTLIAGTAVDNKVITESHSNGLHGFHVVDPNGNQITDMDLTVKVAESNFQYDVYIDGGAGSVIHVERNYGSGGGVYIGKASAATRIILGQCDSGTRTSVRVNDVSGYSIGSGISVTVDAIPRDMLSGTIIRFTGGGILVLTAPATKGDTLLVGNLSTSAIVDNEWGDFAPVGVNGYGVYVANIISDNTFDQAPSFVKIEGQCAHVIGMGNLAGGNLVRGLELSGLTLVSRNGYVNLQDSFNPALVIRVSNSTLSYSGFPTIFGLNNCSLRFSAVTSLCRYYVSNTMARLSSNSTFIGDLFCRDGGGSPKLTPVSGVITVPANGHYRVEAESGTSDDVHTVNGIPVAGFVSFSIATGGDVITFKDTGGNLALNGDFILDSGTDVILLKNVSEGGNIFEVSRSNNA